MCWDSISIACSSVIAGLIVDRKLSTKFANGSITSTFFTMSWIRSICRSAILSIPTFQRYFGIQGILQLGQILPRNVNNSFLFIIFLLLPIGIQYMKDIGWILLVQLNLIDDRIKPAIMGPYGPVAHSAPTIPP